VEQILSSIRLLENATVQRAMRCMFQTPLSNAPREVAPAMISAPEIISTEDAFSPEALS
jgi:hypothetical protein